MTSTIPDPSTEAAKAPSGEKVITKDAIEQLLYREARYLDDKEYEKWLECYADDVVYWVPSWADDALWREH